MSGKLYGIGIGPGDPELITWKGLRRIALCSTIAVPKSKTGEGLAMQITKEALKLEYPELVKEDPLGGKEWISLDLPMTRDEALLQKSRDQAAQIIMIRLDKGEDIAYLTLGDPTIYSTYGYIQERVLAAGYEVETIPGIPSFCAAAARLNTTLAQGEESLHIIPASQTGAEHMLDLEGSKVLMKSGKSMTHVMEELEKRGLLESAKMVSRCGLDGEEVYQSLVEAPKESDYFTIVIVKDDGKSHR